MSTADRSKDYVEVQRVRQAWIWAVVALIAGGAWFFFIRQVIFSKPTGAPPAPDWVLWVVLVLGGVGLPLLAAYIKLVITVDDRGIHVRYRPFMSITIAFTELESCDARSYRPISEYLGWGIRWSPWRGWALTAAGSDGLQCELSDGRQFLIGTKNPKELLAAVRSHIS